MLGVLYPQEPHLSSRWMASLFSVERQGCDAPGWRVGLGRLPTVARPGCLSRDAVLSHSGTGPVSRVLRGALIPVPSTRWELVGRQEGAWTLEAGGVTGIEVRSVQASLISISQRCMAPSRRPLHAPTGQVEAGGLSSS